jgi:hypothetical protein
MEASVYDNVGFQLWNMSKRLSAVERLGHETTALLSQADRSGGWDASDLGELREIARDTRWVAGQAGDVWSRLQEITVTFASGVIEPSDSGPAIVHNRGEDPVAAAAVRKVWEETSYEADACSLARRFDDLLLRRGMEPRNIMGVGDV